MAALGKIHTHYGIAGIKKSKVYSYIRLSTRMRLNICEFGTEKLLSSVARDVFHYINILAAAVVTLAGIALGVLVCKNAAHSRHNCRRNDVFARYKLYVSLLTGKLQIHSLAHFFIIL